MQKNVQGIFNAHPSEAVSIHYNEFTGLKVSPFPLSQGEAAACAHTLNRPVGPQELYSPLTGGGS